MKGLIIKDLLQLKSYLKTLIIFMFIFVCVSIEPKNTNMDGILTMMITLGLGMFGMATFSYDEMAKSDRYILTMPFTRKEIVLSKYILIIGLTIIGSILGTIMSIIISLIIKNNLPNIMDLISIALGGILGIALVESIQIPCIYKMGAEKGRIYMFLITILIAFLFGGIIFMGEKIISSFEMFNTLNILNVILNSYFPIVLLALIVIIYFISYKVSYKIYSKKEL